MCVCMTVFLFRLSPRRTNLLNPENKLVQLVLPTFVFNTLLDACITCLHNLSTRHTSRYTYVCLCMLLGFILHACWVAFLTTPGPAYPDPRAWIVVNPSREIFYAAEAWQISHNSFQTCSILTSSRDFFCCSLSSFVIFILCKSLVNHILYSLVM